MVPIKRQVAVSRRATKCSFSLVVIKFVECESFRRVAALGVKQMIKIPLKIIKMMQNRSTSKNTETL